MAMTHDYLDHLNEVVGIAPASSQEELQAAQTISDLMAQHGLEPSIEEFDVPMVSSLWPSILAIAAFIGAILMGTGVLPLLIIGVVLALIPAGLAVARLLGRKPHLAFGPTVRSQNVVAVHRASGPLVTKGSRRIVVVAHYDSPHEKPLLATPLAPYLSLFVRVSRWCWLALGVCAFIQLLVFLPEPLRRLFWVLGILAALPALVLAGARIAERFLPCTLGANDNKAAVAALLGVMENVHPSGLTPTPRPAAEPEDATAEEDEDANATGLIEADAEPAVEVVGVRHGEKVLRSLGILPEDCTIVYDLTSAEAAPKQAVVAEEQEDEDASSTASLQDAAELLSARRRLLMDGEEVESEGPQDDTGLLRTDAALDVEEGAPEQTERPENPTDPEWGQTDFRPQGTVSPVARRASLFDLPDPSATGDFFGGRADETRVAEMPPTTPAPKPAVEPEPLETITADENASENFGSRIRGFMDRTLARFGRDKNTDAADETTVADAQSAEDENPEERGGARRGSGLWRGGAATRSGLRVVEGEADEDPTEDVEAQDEASESQAEVPSEQDLQDAVLSMSDDELLAHDIWFVALGASSLNHAGMKAFLDEHRRDIRGSFVINLDCVGAGTLSLLTREGLELTRRADRRVVRMLSQVASDLHAPVDQVAFDWTDTDATPAMRRSLRAVTLMGLDEAGLPALSGTTVDTAENVSGDQAAKVAQMVTELIRRS